MGEKALIAMSGGVDSSVAALLAKQLGYECIGCTMKLYDNEDAGIQKGHTCCSLDDVEDARSVAVNLKMPYYVFNFKDGFKEKVINRFIDSYQNGMTPNPCIDCNRYMKFDKLFERARQLGCLKVVTGHYARIEENNGEYFLKKALDPSKDQSYVLYNLTQEQLSMILFPLGGMPKTKTRQIAEENGFINSKKHDSQDICFVPDGDYASALKRLSGKEAKPGDFVLSDGTKIGKHKGIICYTVGQRRGLGISAKNSLYVLKISPEDNTVTLGEKDELFSSEAHLYDLNWISGKAPLGEIRCKVKIRYRQTEQPATVIPSDDDKATVIFDEPQRAVTPGQSAVFYDGDVVLGGGIISR